jgi:hypothetical protein
MKSKQIIRNHVRFKGNFNKEVQDEIQGRDLAEFIAEQLKQKNFEVLSVENEEIWFTVNVISDPTEYHLMVSHSPTEEDFWEITCPRTLGAFARLRGKSEDAELRNLIDALDEILHAEKTITDIKWYSDYGDLADDYIQKPAEKRLSTVGKYLEKLFLPLCAIGWILGLIGGISGGKESLLLRIGVIMFLLPIAAWFGLFVINLSVALTTNVVESYRKGLKKRWLRWIFVLILIALLVVPLFLGLLHNPSIDKVMPSIQKVLFSLMILTFFCVMLFIFGTQTFASFSKIFSHSQSKKGKGNEILSFICSLLVLIGFTAFLSGFFAALGLLAWMPETIEFPLAHVADIDISRKGNLFVASQFYSRIQVYDPEGHFIRGWFLSDTGGGSLQIKVNDEDEIDIAILKSDKIDTFDSNGRLLNSKIYKGQGVSFGGPLDYKQKKHLINESTKCRYDIEGLVFPKIIRACPDGKKKIGKNAFYLFPFQGPFQALATAMFGGCLLGLGEKNKKKKRSS